MALPVALLTIVLVSVLATSSGAIDATSDAQLVVDARIVACADLHGHVRRHLGDDASALPLHGRQGVDVHEPAHGVAAIEGALWPTQHLHSGYVGDVEVVVLLAHHRHIVDVEAHRGLVDACTQATNINSRGHSTTIFGQEEVGHKIAHATHCDNAVALHLTPVEHCAGRGEIDVSALLDGCDIHITQRNSVGNRFSVGSPHWQGGEYNS